MPRSGGKRWHGGRLRLGGERYVNPSKCTGPHNLRLADLSRVNRVRFPLLVDKSYVFNLYLQVDKMVQKDLIV